MTSAKRAQDEYYTETGTRYDEMQDDPTLTHEIALGWLASLIELRGYASLLDVGSGTGRVLLHFRQKPDFFARGVEPSRSMREVAYGKGVSDTQLTEGDALSLAFPNDSFDVVCAFGVLHHIGDHCRAVAEMRRVAAKAVFISDSNNFGQGSLPARIIKQFLRSLRLWRAFDFVKSGFKSYHYSASDGIFYSYSMFDDIHTLREKFPNVYYMSTRPSGPNLYRTAPTCAVFASLNKVVES
jgi:ubiquinone/menaquinone biosynthesis C-methylase UbiE